MIFPMSNILILNGHHPCPFSEGRLNAALVDRAQAFFEAQGDVVKTSITAGEFDVEEEIAKLLWADLVVLQYPVNWMGAPWSLKKYIDEVFTAGMDGRLMTGDGRTSEAPTKNYGMGGVLQQKSYIQSVTYNAPREAVDNPEEPFLQGASVDDMLLPMHLNLKFMGLQRTPTFVAYTFFAYDVMRNPQIEADFVRFDAHLKANFAKTSEPA